MNVFAGTLRGGAVDALATRWPLPPLAGSATEGQAVQYGIRPGDLALAGAGIAAQVVVVEPTGAETELLVTVDGQQLTLVMHGRADVKPEQTVHLAVDTEKAHVFDAASGQRL
jgi:multiple sugar transport system ATP-binding protein